MKKILIVYESVHKGNTEKIAEIMGEHMGCDVFRVDDIDVSILQDYEIIGFGSGIYFGKHHKSLLEFIDDIEKLEKKTFIFSTRSITPLRIAHRTLRRKLIEKDASIIGEFSCKGENEVGPFKLFGGICRGRPNKKDIERAISFAEKTKKLA
ncbi:MAG: flavodoxin [Thermoplasmata archaeon]|nr:MAG: flavodoxin [Thermoplasmata archaeon]KAA0016533.1 MAG: flavodoxin [Thermoplasmata archaeon]